MDLEGTHDIRFWHIEFHFDIMAISYWHTLDKGFIQDTSENGYCPFSQCPGPRRPRRFGLSFFAPGYNMTYCPQEVIGSSSIGHETF